MVHISQVNNLLKKFMQDFRQQFSNLTGLYYTWWRSLHWHLVEIPLLPVFASASILNYYAMLYWVWANICLLIDKIPSSPPQINDHLPALMQSGLDKLWRRMKLLTWTLGIIESLKAHFTWLCRELLPGHYVWNILAAKWSARAENWLARWRIKNGMNIGVMALTQSIDQVCSTIRIFRVCLSQLSSKVILAWTDLFPISAVPFMAICTWF